MQDETLVTLTADIVSAHVGHNAVTVDDMPALIKSVYASLENLGKTVEAPQEKRDPAVSVRASVKPDALTCLECGNKMKMLKRHLATDHGITPAEYRQAWGLPSDYPMVAPNYAARRKELAVKIGLGRKPKAKTEMSSAAPADGQSEADELAKPKRGARKSAATSAT